MDKKEPYRQPLVTVACILLGFTLNVGANWAPRAFSTGRLAELLALIALCVHLPLYIIVIYRALSNKYPKDRADAYYHRTLVLMVVAMCISFLIILMILAESYFRNRG